MNALTKQVEAHGIRIVYEARVLTLIVDEDRSVVGMVARIDQQEKHVKVRKGVILCAGGFNMNIEFYNKHAANGEDPLFHKSKDWLKPLEAPYAALDCTPGRGAIIPFFTLGGLDTLPTGEVLTPEGEVIPGLFAAGRNTCGIPRTSAGYGSGMSVGMPPFSAEWQGKLLQLQKDPNSWCPPVQIP